MLINQILFATANATQAAAQNDGDFRRADGIFHRFGGVKDALHIIHDHSSTNAR